MVESLLNEVYKYVVLSTFVVSQFFGTFMSADKTTSTELYVEKYPEVVLQSLWLEYRDRFIQKDGRTVDRTRNYITTSEGQSYSLLRSVWVDDKITFDQSLKWTINNLRKRGDDKLFAWKWGQDSHGKWDVLVDEGGINTATDSDQDIALALIFASKRWNNEDYLKLARVILDDMWRVEVEEINGRPYLLAGNWSKDAPEPTVNPSYYSFAAYPIFAEVDPTKDWMGLKDTSYEVLNSATSASLGVENNILLPPDWVGLDPTTAEVKLPLNADKDTSFSDDAIRIPWRVALDYMWHKDPRALEYLQKLEFLSKEWDSRGKLFSGYNRDGSPKTDYESVSTYGGSLGYFLLVDPENAHEIFNQKLVSTYNSDTETLHNFDELAYYEQNWLWFGIALYHHELPNLYSEIKGEE